MAQIKCDPILDKEIVRTLRGQETASNAFVCLYAAQRIEDLEAEDGELKDRFLTTNKLCLAMQERAEELESEVKAGAHLCATRQDRINDLENLLLLALKALKHIKADNDLDPGNPPITGNMKALLDETVIRIEKFFGSE